MNEYRKQQLQAAALIEQGASAEQIAEVFNWTKSRAAPEQIERPKQKRKRKRKLFRIIRRLLE